MSIARRAALIAALCASACTQPAAPQPAAPAPSTPAAAPANQAPQAAQAAQDQQGGHRKAAVLGPDEVWIDSLDLSLMFQEWGQPRAGRSVDGRPLTLGGVVHEHGVGTHTNSQLLIQLDGGASRLRATVGVDDEVGPRGSAVFEVWTDDTLLLRTPPLRGGDPPVEIDAVIAGATGITLMALDANESIDFDHADWADARLLLLPGRKSEPAAAPLPQEPVLDIARPVPPEPAIHAPRIAGGTPGRPFLFRVPATGEGPLRFTAEGLPAGLALDAETGIIRGELAAPGSSLVKLGVTGPKGSAQGGLVIMAGERQLALTPPLGWNSWNAWGTTVDDAKVRAAADALVSSGLAAHGFQYVNIDDGWEGPRDPQGNITSNEKFPDMKALADYVHARGLKLGIYSSPGPKTCAGYEGSLGHEAQDAARWAEWGVDYLKHDWCSYEDVAADESPAERQKPYRVMRAALDGVDRDIVYSLCQYGMSDVWTWGADVGGNLWRTTGDITDRWSSVAEIGFRQADCAEFGGPGHWNDPDMLVVGTVGWGGEQRRAGLTRNEQIAHVTLWALLPAPLLIGCDLSALDDFTLALLTNEDVLAVNQDPLGVPARRVLVDGEAEVWMRPLSDGTLAVAAFNRGRPWRDVDIDWSATTWKGPQPVRNLWARRDEGRFLNHYNAGLPRHAALLLKIGTPVDAAGKPAAKPAGDK